MKIELWNKLVDLAKTKKDDVYTKEAWKYFVKDGNIGYIGNRWDGIYQVYGSFLTPIWEPDLSKDSYERTKEFDLKIKELRKREGL